MPPSSAQSGPEQLLHQARAGDRSALGRLLDAYRHYVKLLARLQIDRRLQGKVDASDLVQQTFLEAHRDFAQFRGAGEAEWAGWLRQILARNLANVVRHYLGTARRDVRLERELALAVDQSSELLDRGLRARDSSPGRHDERRENARVLADALARLPADYREVLVLRHLEGLSFPEVARRMGWTVGSVKNLWSRALARLRRTLGETP
jgi:RNA polymerase sigma-70 factor (ECF subfamily)